MDPVLIRLGDFALPAYGSFLSLAFAIGIAFAALRAPRVGLDAKMVIELGIWILLASLLGSRLFYAASHWHEFTPPGGTWTALFVPRSGPTGVAVAGLSVMGGLPAALLAAWAFLRWRRLPVLAYMDLCAPSVALGAGITRLGCFLNGCCFGSVCSWPWAVRFPEGSLPVRALGDADIHPSQLYAAAAGFALFVVLLWLSARRPFEGAIVAALVAGMGVQRLGVELTRHHSAAETLWLPGLSIYMPVALALALAGGWLWVRFSRRSLP